MAISATHLMLTSRPQAEVSASNFRIEKVSLGPLQPGEVLIKVIYLSIDPAIRMYISDRKTYWRQVGIGEAVPTLGIGSVVESASKRYKVGDLVRGMMPCGDFTVVPDTELFGIPAVVKHLPMLMGPLGHHGLTAYVGLVNVGEVKKGDTVLVSVAAGATGSAVVQVAKLLGCRVVGIVGTEEKRQWVSRMLQVDCVNYNEAGSMTEQLRLLCPRGIDVYWDNVGGSSLDAALTLMNKGGRAILCGVISGYDRKEEEPCYNMHLAIAKSISLRGFIVRNYEKDFKAAITALMGWAKKGKLISKETILQGLSNVPEGLRMVFRGANIGKTIVQVSEDPLKAPKL